MLNFVVGLISPVYATVWACVCVPVLWFQKKPIGANNSIAIVNLQLATGSRIMEDLNETYSDAKFVDYTKETETAVKII